MMLPVRIGTRFLFLAPCLGPAAALANDGEPRALLEGHRLERLATEPEVVTPVGLATLGNGDLLVVESHTHQRPGNYAGPEGDRIRRFVDSDGDGRPDRWGDNFATGFRHAMSLAVRPDGGVYLVTRGDVHLLTDDDGDGVADGDEVVVRLDMEVDYPHNALSGICLVGERLYLGMGENFGGRYTIIGSDGSSFTDEGGCGRVFVCAPDGSEITKYASGLWNPFGLCETRGRLYCIDNDPDSSPPCRLLEVQHGDDFGYRYEYHRGGLHPLQAWDGELPGTKGMVAGVGEAPTGMVAHRGWLWVTSWGEHRIERYRLRLEGSVVKADREVVVQGTADFRPTGLTIGADGALYFGDWVSRSYPVHGQGKLWRLELPADEVGESLPPFQPRSLRERLLRSSSMPRRLDQLRVAHDEGRLNASFLGSALRDPDPEVRLCAVRYAAELRLEELREPLEVRLQSSGGEPRETLAILAALEWIDPERRAATSTGELMARHLTREGLPLPLRTLALRSTPPDHELLRGPLLDELLASEDPGLRGEAHWTLALQAGPGRLERLRAVARDRDQLPDLRALAIVGLSSAARQEQALLDELRDDPAPVVALEAKRVLRLAGLAPTPEEARPALEDLADWRELLAEGGDAASGKRLFFTTAGPNCAACHRHSGRGASVGPDLTRIHAQQSRGGIVTSILRPNQEVAPRYEPWELVMRDGAHHTGYLLPQGGDNGRENYLASSGERFTVQADEIESRRVSELSIMPGGLEAALTTEDLRDLVAFLAQGP